MANVPAWARKPKRQNFNFSKNAGVTIVQIITRKPDGTLLLQRKVPCNRLQHRNFRKDSSVVMLHPVYATDPNFGRNGWDRRTSAEKAMMEVIS